MKLDSHVHTRHSGHVSIYPLSLVMRESYNTPEGVYRLAKLRGMGLVTVTDHDRVDGALSPTPLLWRRSIGVSPSCRKWQPDAMKVAVFTDNDFDKINGVTTTLTALLRHAPADIKPRIFTAAGIGADYPDYLALRSFGVGMPFYPGMRMYVPTGAASSSESTPIASR